MKKKIKVSMLEKSLFRDIDIDKVMSKETENHRKQLNESFEKNVRKSSTSKKS